jgi:stage V sporulation protein R
MKPLFSTSEWSFELIDKTWKAIHKIAKELGLDYHPPQIEIITSEQMLEAYAANGMPIMYNHWSFGKRFVQDLEDYKKGKHGLAYEIVINTNPCIAYCMEDNTMTMQALVMAHAICGHGHFFKNNYLFKDNTRPEAILDYLKFAKKYVAQCEEKYGEEDVASILDACHAIQYQGIDRQKRKKKKASEVASKNKNRQLYMEERNNPTWTALFGAEEVDMESYDDDIQLPCENLLYFIEKKSPILVGWQKELVRIVRKVSQYFYPQMQTKLMNEGFATYTHYKIITELYNRGGLTEGSYLEFLKSHTNVIFQSGVTAKIPGDMFPSINVYALGFAMFKDIERICTEPDAEDLAWFPEIAGNGKPWETIKDIAANFRDDSFVQQFLSPKIMREFKLFSVLDKASETDYIVSDTSDEEGYKELRNKLSEAYTIDYRIPTILVMGYEESGSRMLHLSHTAPRGKTLDEERTKRVMEMVHDTLWGFDISIVNRDDKGVLIK